MTREEQIDWLCRLRAYLNNGIIITPWNKEFTEALNKALEQEPCEDAISRQAVKELYYKNGYIDFRKICELPPVTPQPKHGIWIHHKEKMFDCAEHWECSQCHRTTMTNPLPVNGNDYDAMYYCPKCGTNMVEPQESEK